MEQNADRLEEKNKWLTDKLIWHQRKFLERTCLGNSRAMVRYCFEGWVGELELLRYDRQLDEQTKSIKQCKEVTRELGAALVRQQEVTRKHAQAYQQVEADVETTVAANYQLMQFSQKQAAEIESLQRQMQLLMSSHNRQHMQLCAESILDSLKEVKSQVQDG